MKYALLSPAEAMHDGAVDGLVLAAAWISQHVVVVAVMVDVLVFGNQMHVEDADVDAQSRLAIPERVVRLRSVGDVVGGLETACTVQVLHEHVTGRLHSQP